MKTPEEIKHWLGLMAHYCGDTICEKCEYRDICGNAPNAEDIAADILSFIQQLEEQIDLMKIQMQGDCGVCKHWNSGKCDDCLKNTGRPRWEYEGLPETAKEEIK